MDRESKLFRLLDTCTGYELRRFRVFLQSPYFNQRTEMLAVWDFLRPCFPMGGQQLPDAETVFAIAYPDSRFDMAKHRHLLSDLCKLLETFWQMQQLQRRDDLQQQLLLQALSDRHLDQDFEATMVQAQMALMSSPMRDAHYLRQRFDLALRHHDHLVQQSNRSTQAGLQAAMEALDEEFVTHKLRLAAAAINRANVVGESTDLSLLPEVLAFFDAAPPVVFAQSLAEVYRLIVATLQSGKDHEAFTRLLQLLEENQSRYSQATLAELYAFALNYCVRMVNLAEPGFDAQLFDLYQLLIARDYLLDQGAFPVQHFKNFVTLGLRLGHATRLTAEIPALGKKLPEDIRANALLFSQAALSFHQGDFSQCLKLLQKVDFVDVYYHLDAKSLLLKAWYELGEIEPLISLMDTFKTYLRRSRKISDYQRTTYRNQIKIVQLLVRLRLGSRKAIPEIKEALQNLRPIADLQWLERKVEAWSN